ncbi:hypothetical protein H351_31715 (plasmid) [Rhodococcus erythropolis R138]|uniref:response regulator transcription factor n=1 Tax=Rhodococcus erythropolis TaxID=1833 RepID=UPI0004A876AE|nr:hypothetical protein H351_31715 [Rhodococcus erythropolis R138]
MAIDGREAVLWTCNDGAPRVYTITGGDLPEAMEKALTRVWSSGLPLRDHIDLRRRDFDNIAIAIIRALSAGSTDEVAARQLSVSPRTYRRHLASIMERLGITTRFQLGARAAELGLPG